MLMEEKSDHEEMTNVVLHIYDVNSSSFDELNNSNVQINKIFKDGIGLKDFFHSAVQVHGDDEWSFRFCEQGTGVFSCPATKNPMHEYRATLVLGQTNLCIVKVDQILRELSRDWPGFTYNLFVKNCNHFCDELCEKLGVPKLPGWVNRLAHAGDVAAEIARNTAYHAGEEARKLELKTFKEVHNSAWKCLLCAYEQFKKEAGDAAKEINLLKVYLRELEEKHIQEVEQHISEIWKKDKALEEANSKMQLLEENNMVQVASIESLQSQVMSLKERLPEDQTVQRLQKDNLLYLQESIHLRNEIKRLRELVESLRKEEEKLQAEMEDLRKHKDMLLSEVASLREEIEKQQINEENLQAVMEDLRKYNDMLVSEADSLREEIEKQRINGESLMAKNKVELPMTFTECPFCKNGLWIDLEVCRTSLPANSIHSEASVNQIK